MKKNFRIRNAGSYCKIAALVSLFPMMLMAETAEPKMPEETKMEKKTTFFTGSNLSGGLFMFGRNRDRLKTDGTDSTWTDNLDHISTLASMGIKSRDYLGIMGYEVAGFAVMDVMNGDPSGVNQENEFSFAGNYWSNNWDDGKPRNGASVYRALGYLKLPLGLTLQGGIGQFGIEGVIGTNWSYFPGAYTGGKADLAIGDKLSLSYAIVNKYKAPWFQSTTGFSKRNAWAGDVYDDANKIDYLQGGSIKFKINDNHVLTASVGNSEGYMMNYFGKYGAHLDVADGLDLSYQLYVSDIYDEDNKHEYDGYAQYHAITAGLNASLWNLRLEGTHTIAEGAQGNYLPRLTRGYANSQGGFQIWWDMRSDWNENNETAIFMNVSRKLDDLFGVKGWTIGAGGAFGFGAEYEGTKYRKPLNDDGSENIQYKDFTDGQEAAWKVDVSYTTDVGRFKGATFAIHYMQYTNMQSEYGDWAIPNMFSSERDFMVKAILPFGQKL